MVGGSTGTMQRCWLESHRRWCVYMRACERETGTGAHSCIRGASIFFLFIPSYSFSIPYSFNSFMPALFLYSRSQHFPSTRLCMIARTAHTYTY